VAQGQDVNKGKVIQIFQSLARLYRSYATLHFSVLYRFASEENPGVTMDSLKGEFTMSGDKYRYVLDSTEFIGDHELSLALYRQDALMMLKRQVKGVQGNNPLVMPDSLMLKNESIRYRLEETNDRQTIILTYPPGLPTKRMEYIIDRKSGLILKMISIVSAKELYDPSVRSLVTDGPTYAIVETILGDYRVNEPGLPEPDIYTYIKKEGKTYKPLHPYEDFKIALNSSDL